MIVTESYAVICRQFLTELLLVILIRRLEFSAPFDWDDMAHVQKRLRSLGRVLRSPELMEIGNLSFPPYRFSGSLARPVFVIL